MEIIYKAIFEEKYFSLKDGLLILLNLDKINKISKKKLKIFINEKKEISFNLTSKQNEFINFLLKNKNKLSSKEIKKTIIYETTNFLEDIKKSHLGKYYTPSHIVNLIYKKTQKYLKKNIYIMDIAAGCGAFLEKYKKHKIIGSDIDEISVYILNELGFSNIICDNSLYNIHRKKYNLKEKDDLIIVGNPPYNDTTSFNKKNGNNAKKKIDLKMDKDVKDRDYGISFLRAYSKLLPEIICILHPLSYLIKKTNFKRLNNNNNSLPLFDKENSSFSNNYLLKDATIFSSQEFPDMKKNTPFPIVAALYQKNKKGMDYDYILNFPFKILNEKKKFILKKIKTIDEDNYIRKYPPIKKNKKIKSDINLYMYNIRDTNSLLTKGNLTTDYKPSSNITIHLENFYKYAYLNCMKRYFEKDFKFGNLSPIVDKLELEKNESLKFLFILDTIFNNQNLFIFNINKSDNKINKIFSDIKQKKIKTIFGLNVKNIILEYLHSKKINQDYKIKLKKVITKYFKKLKNKYIN